jgi:pimeloyl-ACP methyl ester carboxylesterase
VHCPIMVASGAADTITPAAGCESLARERGVPYRTLGPVGHACPLEAAATVNQLLMNMGHE